MTKTHELEARRRELNEVFASGSIGWDQLKAGLAKINDLIGPQPVLPSRPQRTLPSLATVARHWLNHPKWPEYHGNYIGPNEPFCAGCKWLPPLSPGATDAWKAAAAFLDKAHLITRALGGLDGPQNLVPLCHRCHAVMPDFAPGEEDQALAWVQQRPEKHWGWQLITDSLGTDGHRAVAALLSSLDE